MTPRRRNKAPQKKIKGPIHGKKASPNRIGFCRGRAYAVPIVAKHWDRPPNIFGETSEYVPCGAIYWHRLANMCG